MGICKDEPCRQVPVCRYVHTFSDYLKGKGSQESDPGCLVRCSTEKLDWLMNVSYNKANGY